MKKLNYNIYAYFIIYTRAFLTYKPASPYRRRDLPCQQNKANDGIDGVYSQTRVKTAERSGAPEGLGLDTRVVYWMCPHGRHYQSYEIPLRSEHVYIVSVLKWLAKFR
jgi:hypothetical protein